MLHFLSSEEIKNLLAFSSTVSTIFQVTSHSFYGTFFKLLFWTNNLIIETFFQFASGILIVRNYFKKKSCGEVSILLKL